MATDEDNVTKTGGTSRCDGCGEEVPDEKATHFRRSSGNRRATYGPRCDALRKKYDVRPEDHEQYRLDEKIAEIEGWSA